MFKIEIFRGLDTPNLIKHKIIYEFKFHLLHIIVLKITITILQ